MKVKELIEELKKHDPENEVYVYQHEWGCKYDSFLVPYKVESNNGKKYYHNDHMSEENITAIWFVKDYDERVSKD